MKDLKRKMESSQLGKLPASLRYNTIYARLNDAEGAATELIHTNKKLKNSDSMDTNSEDGGSGEDGKLQNKQEGNQIR